MSYPKCYIRYNNGIYYPIIKINWYTAEKYVARHSMKSYLVTFSEYIRNPNMDFRCKCEDANNDLQIFLKHNKWLGEELYDSTIKLKY